MVNSFSGKGVRINLNLIQYHIGVSLFIMLPLIYYEYTKNNKINSKKEICSGITLAGVFSFFLGCMQFKTVIKNVWLSKLIDDDRFGSCLYILIVLYRKMIIVFTLFVYPRSFI